MAREAFEKRPLSGKISIGLDNRTWVADMGTIIKDILRIVTSYEQQGYRLTLRQLYYQLVSSDSIPNHDKVYKKIGGILDNCRYSGLLDWHSIEDRGRVPKIPYWVRGIKDALNDTVRQYRLNRQDGQDKMIELWTEKDAISNILFRVTSKYHVNLVVNKGYTSSSAIYQAYTRFAESINKKKQVVILYFGDHDPSGLDMVRDIEDRLIKMFVQGDQINRSESYDWAHENDENEEKVRDLSFEIYPDGMPEDEDGDIYDGLCRSAFVREFFKVIQIGLTRDQIRQYKLPPNPAKITDPRAKEYIKKFGQTSWEVDALKPDILTSLVESNILKLIDENLYEGVMDQEKADKVKIKKWADKQE